MEGKGLKVNVDKTKVMVCGESAMIQKQTCKWPCAICAKGVGRNSIQCGKCTLWVHKRCSGIKGSLVVKGKDLSVRDASREKRRRKGKAKL